MAIASRLEKKSALAGRHLSQARIGSRPNDGNQSLVRVWTCGTEFLPDAIPP